MSHIASPVVSLSVPVSAQQPVQMDVQKSVLTDVKQDVNLVVLALVGRAVSNIVRVHAKILVVECAVVAVLAVFIYQNS